MYRIKKHGSRVRGCLERLKLIAAESDQDRSRRRLRIVQITVHCVALGNNKVHARRHLYLVPHMKFGGDSQLAAARE